MTAAVSSSVNTAGLAAALMAPPAAPRGAGFAQVLSAQQAQQRAPEPAPTPTPADKPTAADKPKQAEGNAQARAADEARARQLRAVRSAGRPQGPETPPAREPAAEVPQAPAAGTAQGAPEDDKAKETADAVDPAIADWLSRLNLPESPTEAATVKAPAQGEAVLRTALVADAGARVASQEDTDIPEDRPTVRRAGAGASSETALRQREGIDDKTLQRAASGSDDQPAGAPAAFQAALEQAAVPVASNPARAADGLKVDAAGATAAAQGLAAGQPLAERATEAPVPTVVHVPTPADAPEFPKALGTQLSVLAQDGIQHAELHLNPVDMGPISVQIVLDGDQAKVDFGADSAATRQIIENGLPELAAALRDAGFTLSGGGVHSQAQNTRGGDGRSQGQGGGAQGEPGGDEPQAIARPVTRTRAGGIDLYA